MRRFFVSLMAGAACALLCASTAIASSPQQTLQRALSSSLSAAGGATGAYVVDLTAGRPLFSARPGSPRLPASVEKIYTTSSALSRFGPNATLETTIRGTGSLDRSGTWRGTLYLKGGGDPTFGSVSFDRYAYGAGATMQRLVANLLRDTPIKALRGSIVGDESMFDSRRGTPPTGFAFSPYIEGLLSGLAYDRGLADEQGSAYQNRPALFAAQRFTDALRAAHVRVPGQTQIYTAPAPRLATVLASVNSPRIATLIRLTNTPSDNFFAEMLLKDIGARFGGRGSTAAGAAVVRNELASSFGIHPRLEDGSGLSRADYTSPREVVKALTALADNQPFLDSLAVAGRTGTLQYGLQGTSAQDRCRGKSGTLHDAANLVGYCTARDHHTLVFAFLMNAVDPVRAHALEDDMAAAVARYSG